MGNSMDVILSCGNQNDALAARDKELEDIKAQAEDFRLQAERYKKQLDEATWALAKNNNKAEAPGTKGVTKSISFKTDQTTPTNSGKDSAKDGGAKTENKKRILNPSLFSYNPSGRI